MKGRRSTIARMGGYLMQEKWRILLAFLLTVTSNGLALLGPMLSGKAIDAIELGPGKVDFSTALYYAKWMLMFYLLSAAMTYLLNVLMIAVSRRITYRMRQDMFRRLVDLPVSFFDTHATGDIISRISYDIDTINTSLSSDLIQVLASGITIVGALAMMVRVSPKMVLIFLFTVPLSVFLTQYITKRTQKLFRVRSKKQGDLNGFVEEMVSGQKTLKAYCREQKTVENFDGENRHAAEAYYQSEYYTAGMGPSVNFINNLSLSFISVIGAAIYMAGEMTVGNISSFVLYSRKFSGPIHEIAEIWGDLQSAIAAAERVFRVLDEPMEKADAPDAGELLQPAGQVELENVSFGYTPGRTVLKDFSLQTQPGQLIAIVGPTGAGKTTLINLLMRFYDPQSGEIRMDGHPAERLTRASLRRAYSMVLQDTWLFYGSIYENIAYGRPEATREEVEAAAKAAKIDSFIRHLPKGYDTLLTDDAANISKGQKQLLTIARAMLMNSPMLILDEATSNVDTRTEVLVQQAMRTLMQDKTCFVVAHRLSTVQNADRILVVRDGNVVETGTHQELMEQGGFYRELYQAQWA